MISCNGYEPLLFFFSIASGHILYSDLTASIETSSSATTLCNKLPAAVSFFIDSVFASQSARIRKKILYLIKIIIIILIIIIIIIIIITVIIIIIIIIIIKIIIIIIIIIIVIIRRRRIALKGFFKGRI